VLLLNAAMTESRSQISQDGDYGIIVPVNTTDEFCLGYRAEAGIGSRVQTEACDAPKTRRRKREIGRVCMGPQQARFVVTSNMSPTLE
jgi:hypothetical protein